MRTWHDNAKAINQLWQTFQPSDELRMLFRDTFDKLDQDVLYVAIRNARADNDGPWPQIKWITSAYAEEQSKRRRASRPAAVERREPTKFDVPEKSDEQTLLDQIRQYIGVCREDQFREIESRILSKLDAGKLSMHGAFSVLMDLRRKVFGDGPGLSVVTLDGELRPLSPLIDA